MVYFIHRSETSKFAQTDPITTETENPKTGTKPPNQFRTLNFPTTANSSKLEAEIFFVGLENHFLLAHLQAFWTFIKLCGPWLNFGPSYTNSGSYLSPGFWAWVWAWSSPSSLLERENLKNAQLQTRGAFHSINFFHLWKHSQVK